MAIMEATRATLLPLAPSDAQIHQGVHQELARDRHVAQIEVGVEVCDGVVLLMGTVDSYVAKLAAQDAAHRVPGVRAVGNDLVVRMPGVDARTSADIARAARGALERDVLVPYERIRTTVADSWVTLEGQVERAHQREDAEWAVRHVAGVRGVMNRVTIGAPGVTGATPIRAVPAPSAVYSGRRAGPVQFMDVDVDKEA